MRRKDRLKGFAHVAVENSSSSSTEGRVASRAAVSVSDVSDSRLKGDSKATQIVAESVRSTFPMHQSRENVD